MDIVSTTDLKHHEPTMYQASLVGCECGWKVNGVSAVSSWGQYIMHLPKLDATGELILTPDDVELLWQIWLYADKGTTH